MKIDPNISSEDFLSQYRNSYAWYEGKLCYITGIAAGTRCGIHYVLSPGNFRGINGFVLQNITIIKPQPHYSVYEGLPSYGFYKPIRGQVNGIKSDNVVFSPYTHTLLRFINSQPLDKYDSDLLIQAFLLDTQILPIRISYQDAKDRAKNKRFVLLSSQLMFHEDSIWHGNANLYPSNSQHVEYLRRYIPDLPEV